MTPYIFPGMPEKYQYNDWQSAIRLVENTTGVSYSQMKDRTRRREIVEARQLAMCLLRSAFKNLSLAQIGSKFNRDHATVLHAHKTIRNLREVDQTFCVRNAKILNQIRDI
jgi:chromosomal replication initiation ATPase DnaA